MKSRGEFILFADADGASRFSDFSKLEEKALKNCETLEVFCLLFSNYQPGFNLK